METVTCQYAEASSAQTAYNTSVGAAADRWRGFHSRPSARHAPCRSMGHGELSEFSNARFVIRHWARVVRLVVARDCCEWHGEGHEETCPWAK